MPTARSGASRCDARQASGGNVKGCLYLADHIQPGLPIFITEGEFDALIARQVGGKNLAPVSIGSASNWRINGHWFGKLLAAPRICVCFDSDQAGVKAAEIALLSSAVQVVRAPVGKDMTEFYLRDGKQPVCDWLEQVTEQHTFEVNFWADLARVFDVLERITVNSILVYCRPECIPESLCVQVITAFLRHGFWGGLPLQCRGRESTHFHRSW